MRNALLSLLLIATATPALAHPNHFSAAAVAAPGRPPESIALDAGRKPAEVLDFMMLRPGMRTLDVITGGGYYAEVMGRVVGTKGSVVAYNPAALMDDKGKAKLAALTARTPNVRVVTDPRLAFAPGAYDFAMIHLNYHDFYFENKAEGFERVDPNQVLGGLFRAMKPGGIVAVVDHVGMAGDTRAIVDKLHRIDPATVKADFARAGFVLDGESQLLRNANDDHTKLVFDPSIRGKTDRMMLRFKKPKA